MMMMIDHNMLGVGANIGLDINGDLGMGVFDAEVDLELRMAINDPEDVHPESLINLAKIIVDRAISECKYAKPAAKICISIIQIEESDKLFLKAMVRRCQLSYQQRNRMLSCNTTTTRRYYQYMTFLYEMLVMLKTYYYDTYPQSLLLNLLGKSFIDCLQTKVLSIIEIETMFFILISVGQDLDGRSPQMTDQIFHLIRDALLTNCSAEPVKTKLLQLIEMRASKWILPSETITYYYPSSVDR